MTAPVTRCNVFVDLSCTAQEVFVALEEGYVLTYDGKAHAYLQNDEPHDIDDEPHTRERVPVEAVRELITAGVVEESGLYSFASSKTLYRRYRLNLAIYQRRA